MTEHTQEQYGLRREAAEFPMMVVVSFVYICNARCVHCPYTNSQIRAQYKDHPIIAPDLFRKICDECGPYHAYVRISGGGEPMLHPQAVELLTYAKRVGAKVGLITNGSRFDEHSTEALLAAGVDVIEFSADAGDAAAYERIRVGLKWDVLVRNVERMVATRDRLKAPAKIIVSAVHQKDVDMDASERFWRPRVDNFQKRKYLTWAINPEDKSADPTPYLDPKDAIPCPFLFERLNMDSRGVVMVCGFDIAARTNMGNVAEKTIKEIWLGKAFEWYRQKHLQRCGHEIELCASCPDWKYRSWQHNYWKLVQHAEQARKARFDRLHEQDSWGEMAVNDDKG